MWRSALRATGLVLGIFGTLLTVSYGKESAVKQLDEKSFEPVKRSSKLWVIEFFSPSCQHCERAGPKYERIAAEVDYVNFAAVDIDGQKALAAELAIEGPTQRIHFQSPQLNATTQEVYHVATSLDLSPDISVSTLESFIRENLPNRWHEHSWRDFEKIAGEYRAGSITVVLFSNQDNVASMFLALEMEHFDRGWRFVHVRCSREDPVERVAITTLPALAVITESAKSLRFFNGSLKSYSAIKDFLDDVASSEGSGIETNQEATAKEHSGSKLTSENFESAVLTRETPWLISFQEEGDNNGIDILSDNWKEVVRDAKRKVGILGIGFVECGEERELCKRYGEPGLKVFKFSRDTAIDAKIPEDVSSISIGWDIATKSIPDETQRTSRGDRFDLFVSNCVSNNKLPVVLFTKKAVATTLIRSVAIAFSEYASIATYPSPSVEEMNHFGVASLPAIVSMFRQKPEDGELEKPGSLTEVNFGIISYNKQLLGPFTFDSIGGYILKAYDYAGLPPIGQAKRPNQHQQQPDESREDDVARVIQLSASNFEECLSSALCVIGFLNEMDDVPEGEYSRLLSIAQQSKNNREPFVFGWVNGHCQPTFSNAFDIQQIKMPTMVVLSPKKKRFAQHIGSFDKKSAGRFLRDVLGGHVRTVSISQVPTLNEVDCDAVVKEIQAAQRRALELDAEDTEDYGSMLAEILVEEQRKKEEIDARLQEERKRKEEDKIRKLNVGAKKKRKKKRKKKKKSTAKDEL